MSDELLRLADRIESMTGPSVDADAEIALAIGQFSEAHYGMWHEYVMEGHSWPHDEPVPVPPSNFTASLDSAVTLVPEGDDYSIGREGKMGIACVYDGASAITISGETGAATPPLALCVAALRARASRLRMEVE